MKKKWITILNKETQVRDKIKEEKENGAKRKSEIEGTPMHLHMFGFVISYICVAVNRRRSCTLFLCIDIIEKKMLNLKHIYMS
jgi:hypothetical protein